MKMLRSLCMILLVAVFCIGFVECLHTQGRIFNLKENSNESMDFRSQKFDESSFETVKEISVKEQIPIWELLSVWMPKYAFSLEHAPACELTKQDFYLWRIYYQAYNRGGFEKLQKSYAAVWEDLAYFPVPDSAASKEAVTSFEDSWMMERNYGGKRGHEGCDIFPAENERDRYPVVSATAGTVEKIGWLEKGGYRIGVRSFHGGYFYYAHLSSYAKDFREGDQVEAGELLGYMGDTGYSEIEGTVGKFDVHLHFGIYIQSDRQEEVSVNPYWILRYLEDHKLKYAYEM